MLVPSEEMENCDWAWALVRLAADSSVAAATAGESEDLISKVLGSAEARGNEAMKRATVGSERWEAFVVSLGGSHARLAR